MERKRSKPAQLPLRARKLRLDIMLEREQMDRLRRTADALGISRSEAIRRAIAAFTEHHLVDSEEP